MSLSFHGHGKLLISGEYTILDGALALALPLKMGQQMTVSALPAPKKQLHWKSLNEQGEAWFEAQFVLPQLKVIYWTDEGIGKRLLQLLKGIQGQQPHFFDQLPASLVETRLHFNRQWGLGSSSTLLYMLSQWADTDPYQLSADSFGGSGYDIACAGAEGPILYQKLGRQPLVKSCRFQPSFADQLLFVYLDQKQDSREGIVRYRQRFPKPDLTLLQEISALTGMFLTASDADTFAKAMWRHELLVGEALGLEPVKVSLFRDFIGMVKSLGAWGGDFILAIANDREEAKQYFHQKGYSTTFAYEDLVLEQV